GCPVPRPSKSTRWNQKKFLFVEAILTGETGAEAARQAGYSPRNASGRAHELMKDPLVVAELEKRREVIRAENDYTREKAMDELEATMTFARETKNAGALAKAVELRAKLAGHLIERRDVRQAQVIKVEVVQFDDGE
ncbi:MAG: terminase small subunit, partial [Alphaproteobacteria bacterium]|nr:terminase small subunit [Alphaproteobacteria bacterium]